MTSPTGAEIKAKIFGLARSHWPMIVILILTWYGALVDDDHVGHVVQVVGAAGAIVLLSFFKLQKNIWLYISAVPLCLLGAVDVIDIRQVADVMGLGWLSSWSFFIIKIAVQGAIASFVFLLLLSIVFSRLKITAAFLVKIPVCMLFLLAALGPSFMVFWTFMALGGLFGPV